MTENTKQPAGYANPPAQHRFKKGKSGNPRGRPRKQADLWSHLDRVLNRKVKLQGSEQQMPIREALIRRLRELALAGDRRALDLQRRILVEAGENTHDLADSAERKRKIVEALRKLGVKVIENGGGDA
ncbi:hypothetical protein U879_03155 [Defluviimonas sp. 20V17]|uniref:DUF5681 domain-containing protein n=1 Tax=Allgaiera indica TaxID=765699 RepID=A0AAN5A1A3_9RHOB|nr:DUF5681 domain-containing protein [Allgaiera indica]KDB05128.1 hypothetical protein U879_03155 [Defluviimonas sp. 20V17]GHE05226.1 hypothetical protein GCM10008024_35240 [Allgaiera indica]SDX68439.1 hypothetical protein SAMN05444006_12419 [Allgaiera indica]